jgi:hypothetical protein
MLSTYFHLDTTLTGMRESEAYEISKKLKKKLCSSVYHGALDKENNLHAVLLTIITLYTFPKQNTLQYAQWRLNVAALLSSVPDRITN